MQVKPSPAFLNHIFALSLALYLTIVLFIESNVPSAMEMFILFLLMINTHWTRYATKVFVHGQATLPKNKLYLLFGGTFVGFLFISLITTPFVMCLPLFMIVSWMSGMYINQIKGLHYKQLYYVVLLATLYGLLSVTPADHVVKMYILYFVLGYHIAVLFKTKVIEYKDEQSLYRARMNRAYIITLLAIVSAVLTEAMAVKMFLMGAVFSLMVAEDQIMSIIMNRKELAS